GLPGIADAHIVLTNLASQIGREEPNKVTLTGDARLDMNSLFGIQTWVANACSRIAIAIPSDARNSISLRPLRSARLPHIGDTMAE
ncbi:DUF1439 domain-containing protein, partial [Salmonella enterica subsp. enterica serovar Kentucky]|nr:DUF1439 domain-containing protein [Salmonella enterica subsp. enterica serovar Kentucky]